MNKKLQIGVIGPAGPEEYTKERAPSPKTYELAEEVGGLLAAAEAIVVTGGKSGVMEAAARGARAAGGLTVGVVKGRDRKISNAYTDVEVLSGMAIDGFDELLLVAMCDGLIAIGGGAGTLEEITLAYRNKKPIVVLEGGGGWADKIKNTFLDDREILKIESATAAEEAVHTLLRLIVERG